MKRLAIAATLALSATLPVTGQTQDVLTRIKQEGLERSKVQALFATLTDQFGPRLAGTPAHKQAAEWARDRMREFGLSDPKLEPWTFGRGWVLDKLVVEMVEPRYMPLIGYAEAWSAPTSGEIVATPIAVGRTHRRRGRGDEGSLERRDRPDAARRGVHQGRSSAALDLGRAGPDRPARRRWRDAATPPTRGPSRRRCARRASGSR